MRITFCFLFIVPIVVRAEPIDKETIQFVQNLQQADGGFIAAPVDPKQDTKPLSSLRATAAAIRALRYFGGELKEKDKVAKFVASCFDEKAGGFADMPKGKPDVFSTSVGLMAVVELKMATKPYEEPAIAFLIKSVACYEDARIAVAGFEAVKKKPPKEVGNRWYRFVEKLANADGTYGTGDGKVRDTGSIVAMKMRMGQFVSVTDELATTFREGQRDDGGFGNAGVKTSDLATTYRVMRAAHMLNGKPKQVDKLKEFVGTCRNASGGYGVEPGKPATVGGTYYAGIILYWVK